MKVITFQGIKFVQLSDVPEPKIISKKDAIVKVERAAICGSDMHVYHGRETGIDIGTIMGHEFTGTVVDTGEHVSNFKVGDRVLSPFTVNCGECHFCKIGLTARCVKSHLYGWRENGSGLHGVHAEYVRVPMADATLVHLPDDLSWEQGNLLSDIASTGYFGAELAELKPDDVCVVIGCGPVGIMAIKAAKCLGCKTIYAVDGIDFRLEFAKRNGAIPVNYLNENVVEKILERTNGIGADSVIEAVGSKTSMKSAFDILRPGGILASVGVQAFDQLPFSPPDMYDKNITLKTGRCSSRFYAEKLIPLIQNGDLQLTDVITHTFDLKDGVEAYRFFDEEKDKCLKVLLKP
ncbi:MAG: alcohol dehydrogenase catalytic domain-containing protein [Balneola sp.]|nr:alcohol dehydrogenase catalytic domain-containing protein [Balneola sp.]MBO6650616.1 alcohol dehydrogenase catalytic domain-containing protein [Balneola sp.]MBO6712605.1 alcohol dehydrogenase catalytic domain-containing protein [Balneola sp.]MBO6800901.1 alcohol dehydrogenase catalytic domain-containing protein [Balneola sp.]MBO6870574.1 alcohol dehydrogenase catalytic domain-containing protein [Balneola sp.]